MYIYIYIYDQVGDSGQLGLAVLRAVHVCTYIYIYIYMYTYIHTVNDQMHPYPSLASTRTSTKTFAEAVLFFTDAYICLNESQGAQQTETLLKRPLSFAEET